MADTKLSALTELAASPADNDELYIRDVSEAAAAESKRITLANLVAAAVQTGAITNGVTKAPTHDAVYDVKVTAEAAQTAAEVDADVATHAGLTTGVHGVTGTILGTEYVQVAKGIYTGNDGVDRQITTGFVVKFLAIARYSNFEQALYCLYTDKSFMIGTDGASSVYVLVKTHATDGFIVNGNGNGSGAFNANGIGYSYIAIG